MNFTKTHGYNTFESVKKLLDIYYEQQTKSKLDYFQFITFLRTDENQNSYNLFDALLPRNAGKKRVIDSKVVIIMILNCISSVPKLDKMMFAFKLFDEEDARIISFQDLKKILQGNYFAGNTAEVESKAKLVIEQATSSAPDQINYDDYIDLGKRFNALFFPLNL